MGKDRQHKQRLSAAGFDEAWKFLESNGWLGSCNTGIRSKLRDCAKRVQYGTGEYLYRFGETANGIFGLVEGTVDSLIPRLDGEEIVIHRAAPGFWVGDLALFATDRRLVSLKAASPVVAVFLPQDRLKPVVSHEPDLFRDFFRLTHENVATMLTLLSNLSVPGARNRIALRLLFQQQLLQKSGEWIPVGQDTLAEMVALSTQTVRRTLRDLEQQGLIEQGYRRIRILDTPALKKLCGYKPPGTPGR